MLEYCMLVLCKFLASFSFKSQHCVTHLKAVEI